MSTSSVSFNWKLALAPMHLVVAIGVFVLDQLTKYLIIFNLELGRSIPVLPFFEIVHVKNKGAAFGIFHDSSPAFRLLFFGAVTIVCLILLTYWLGTTPVFEKLQRLGLSLILGGALGNLKDRAIFGEVTDFVHVFYKSYSWPAFNIADSAISVGVAIIFIHLLLSTKKNKSVRA